MIKRILSLLPLLLLAASMAYATPVTLDGGWTIETDEAVNQLANFNANGGFFSDHHDDYPVLTALGNNWGWLAPDSEISGPSGDANERLSFEPADKYTRPSDTNIYLQGFFANSLTNGAGIDLLVFESGDEPDTPTIDDPNNTEVELVSVSLTGQAGTWVEMEVLDFLYGAVYVYGIDFDALGLNAGATLDNLWFGNSVSYNDWDPDIIYAAGTASAVPVPAAVWLLGSGLIGLAGLGHKSRQY